MNAQHVATAEGWSSPLVWAAIIVTSCAAVTPPFAERAGKTGQPAKALLLWLFFALAVGFSLTASIARSSGYTAGKTATVEQANAGAKLAQEAYEQTKLARDDECKTGRGNRCREPEGKVEEARKALANAAPVVSVDPGAERVAAVLGVNKDSVQLYVPLFLPLGLELGGFIFLAVGLAPAVRNCRKEECKPVAKSANAIANLKAEALATAPKSGTRAWYLARLEREHPAIAKRVQCGELSVYRACIEAGLRKDQKRKAWDANQYLKLPETV